MKKITAISIILILVVFSITNVFASTTMTKEDLEKAIEKFNNVEGMEGEITVDGDKIVISNEEEKYTMSYNLEGNPTFKTQVNINNKMTNEEYNSEMGKLLLLLYGFGIVSIDKEIDVEDAIMYAMFASIKNNNNEIKTSPAEEFNALNLVKEFYKEDNIVDVELYKQTTKIISATEDECVIESIMEVKIEEDFSIIEEFVEDLNKTENNEEVQVNEQIESNEQVKVNEEIENNEENEEVKNIGINEIPQTGKTFGNMEMLWIILTISILALVLYTVYNRKNVE